MRNKLDASGSQLIPIDAAAGTLAMTTRHLSRCVDEGRVAGRRGDGRLAIASDEINRIREERDRVGAAAPPPPIDRLRQRLLARLGEPPS